MYLLQRKSNGHLLLLLMCFQQKITKELAIKISTEVSVILLHDKFPSGLNGKKMCMTCNAF